MIDPYEELKTLSPEERRAAERFLKNWDLTCGDATKEAAQAIRKEALATWLKYGEG